MKIDIDNVYVSKYGEDEHYQTYFVEFELSNDTVENVMEWDRFFKLVQSDLRTKKVKLTIEDETESLPRPITWVNDFCFDCELMIKSTYQEHMNHKRLGDNK